MAIRPKPTVEQGPSRALLALVDQAPGAPARLPDLKTDVARAVRSPTALRPVTLGLPPSLYEDYVAYAQAQGNPLAVILRKILTEGLPAAIGGSGRTSAAPQGLGGVARRTP